MVLANAWKSNGDDAGMIVSMSVAIACSSTCILTHLWLGGRRRGAVNAHGPPHDGAIPLAQLGSSHDGGSDDSSGGVRQPVHAPASRNRCALMFSRLTSKIDSLLQTPIQFDWLYLVVNVVALTMLATMPTVDVPKNCEEITVQAKSCNLTCVH